MHGQCHGGVAGLAVLVCPGALPGMGTLCVPPTSLPTSWHHTQHSKFDSVQLWTSGEMFAGTSYEQMRQLRSLSLRHYMLWEGEE